MSCGNDGLVKVWAIKDNECVAVLEKHAAKVWAVAGKLFWKLIKNSSEYFLEIPSLFLQNFSEIISKFLQSYPENL